ncbi:hypothetical protein BS618_23830 [Rhodococcus erythropolis]|nr:hypothetical protein BS618_23830 [Rhodococcus erythropolis]
MGDALVRTDEALPGMCVDLGKCHVGGFFEDRETSQVQVVLARLGTMNWLTFQALSIPGVKR